MSSTLRQQMLNRMTLRHMSEKTKTAYVSAVKNLSKYYKKSPDKLIAKDVQGYLIHLDKERHLSWNTINVAFSAFRFFYSQILERPEIVFNIPPRRKEKHLPVILSHKEVKLILHASRNFKHRTLLMTMYGSGLRVSEAVRLKLHHIESSRMMIRVEQGKGRKDRYTILPKTLLGQLRAYWKIYQPEVWLFSGRNPALPMPVETAQKIFYNAKKISGVTKTGGIHTLRHCFATHLMDAGCDVYVIKRFMGHLALGTTARYIHVTDKKLSSVCSPLDKFYS